MGRLRTRNLRAKARHYAEAKGRSQKRWGFLVKSLDQFTARMRDLQGTIRRSVRAGFYGGGRMPVFPALPPRPALLPRGEFVVPHRPFLTAALEESMVNVREEMHRAVRDALARGLTVNITVDGKVISTYPPTR